MSNSKQLLCPPTRRGHAGLQPSVVGRAVRKSARIWKSLASALNGKMSPVASQEAFSIFEALYIVLSRVWRRAALPLAFVLCASVLLVTLAVRSSVQEWSYPFKESFVFTAPISGSAIRARSSEPPKFIPRVIHQTYPSLERLPRDVMAIRQTWIRLNPGWEVRFWDDASCLEFVHREFPEYYRAYVALPKNVERADFFRYLVVLRYGGVYADIDAELRQPLDDVIHSTDMLVVGWEAEVADEAEKLHRHLARRRQVRSQGCHVDGTRLSSFSPGRCAKMVGIWLGVFHHTRCRVLPSDELPWLAGAAMVLCRRRAASSATDSLCAHRSALCAYL
jgi:Glycosyltransferase sugar-binding region containing DXD motif